MFFDCKSLFLSLKLYTFVLKVKNINVVLVCNHENKNWKACNVGHQTELKIIASLKIYQKRKQKQLNK